MRAAGAAAEGGTDDEAYPAARPDVAGHGNTGKPDARRRDAAFRETEGPPPRRPRDRRGLPGGRAVATVQLRSGTRRRRNALFPRGGLLRPRLPRHASRAAGRLFARRPAAPRRRPARADARPRPAAVPQLAHRRRAGQPVRAVRESAPRHHRWRIGNEAHLRKPEHERPAHHSDSRVRDRGPGAQAASAESARGPPGGARRHRDEADARSQGRFARRAQEGPRHAAGRGSRWQPAVLGAACADERAAADGQVPRDADTATR